MKCSGHHSKAKQNLSKRKTKLRLLEQNNGKLLRLKMDSGVIYHIFRKGHNFVVALDRVLEHREAGVSLVAGN
jgi:hypothetical protein